jgi:hypothetical protein
MRTHMDPLTPATATLDPTISHIAKTATELAGPLGNFSTDSGPTVTLAQVKRVQWILDSPNRLGRHYANGNDEIATNEWTVIQRTLAKWGMPKGSEELLAKCKVVVERNGRIAVIDEDDSASGGSGSDGEGRA